jgi:hypothetical protein
MRDTRKIWFFFSSVLGFGSLFFIGVNEELDQKSPIRGDYEIGEGARENWTNVCLSSGYEYPDQPIKTSTGVSCGLDQEVPLGIIFATYTFPDGSCEVTKLTGHLLKEGNYETRCFDRKEAEGFSLVYVNGVYDITGEQQ